MLRRTAIRAGLVLYALAWSANRSLRRVTGGSMRPTLSPGELVVVAPVSLARLRRGTVVVVADPRDGRSTIKRVAALAGEDAEVEGRVLRAGAGELVVLGDDPTASTDSRVYGPVATASVTAVVVAAVRPWRRLDPGTG